MSSSSSLIEMMGCCINKLGYHKFHITHANARHQMPSEKNNLTPAHSAIFRQQFCRFQI